MQVNAEPLDWSYIAHAVGDMHNEEECQSATVRLPDGQIRSVVSLEKTDQGWVLTLQGP